MVDADNDEEFVKGLATKYGIKSTINKMDIRKLALENKISEEMAGRQIRYRDLEGLSGSDKKIATAHNLDDSSESILLNIIRGSGLNGLLGIDAKRERLIRPILCLTKKEVISYLEQRELEYRIDKTNSNEIYKRNYIRNIVIPGIEETFNIDFSQNIMRLSMLVRRDEQYLSEIAKKRYDELIKKDGTDYLLPVQAFSTIHTTILSRIIFETINNVSNSIQDIEKKHIQYILDIAKSISGTSIDLPGV